MPPCPPLHRPSQSGLAGPRGGSRGGARPGRWGSRRAHLLAWCFALQAPLVGCASDKGDSDARDHAQDPHGRATCVAVRQRPDETCCQPGTFYDYDHDDCVPFGPIGCETTLFGEEVCTPRWCLALRGEDGAPCQTWGEGCLHVDVACEAPAAACPAGTFSDLGAGRGPDGAALCHDAGSTTRLPGGETAPAKLIPPTPSGPPATVRWCLQSDGSPGPCPAGAKGCEVGQAPDPEAGGACAALGGVSWACPPGFVTDLSGGLSLDDLLPCTPDPGLCGEDAFGGLQDAPGRVFVDASWSGTSDGSRAAPFATLIDAMAKAPVGTLVLAEGDYTVPTSIAAPWEIRGRCADRVTLTGSTGAKYTVFATAVAAPGLRLRDVTVAGPLRGVFAHAGAQVSLERVQIEGVTIEGLRVEGEGTLLQARDIVVRDVAVHPLTKLEGGGVTVQWGAHLALQRARISRSHGYGLLSLEKGTALIADEVFIDGVRFDAATAVFAVGLMVASGSHAQLSRLKLSHNRQAGLVVAGKATAIATQVQIEDTDPLDSGQLATAAVVVRQASTVSLRGARIERNLQAGVLVQNAGSTLTLSDALISETHLSAPTGEGLGVSVVGGAYAQLARVRVASGRGVGLSVSDPASRLQAQALQVVQTLPDAQTGQGGAGVQVTKGAQAILGGTRLHGNHNSGLMIADPNTSVIATDLQISSTREVPAALRFGYGLSVFDGANVEVHGGRISDNRDVGVALGHGALDAVDAGCAATLTDLLVDATRPSTSRPAWGMGVSVRSGCRAVLRRVRIHDVRAHGLEVEGTGSAVLAEDLVVDGTRADQAGSHTGDGLAVLNSAQAVVTRARLHDNVTTGAYVGRTVKGAKAELNGARLRLSDAAITSTRQVAEVGVGGVGASVEGSSSLWMTGVQALDNEYVGVYAQNSRLRLAGSVVAQTRPLPSSPVGGLGYGVCCLASADLNPYEYGDPSGACSVHASALRGNHTAAMMVSGAKATAELIDTVIADTRAAEGTLRDHQPTKVLADGLAALVGATVSVVRTLIQHNPRAGVAVDGGAKVAFSAALVRHNGYGLVHQNAGKSSISTSAVIENTVQNVFANGGMSVPATPAVTQPLGE